MTVSEIQERVTNKDNFRTLQNFFDFALIFLEYIERNKQAEIVSQNERNYRFFQYNQEANFLVTRPFNSNLIYMLDVLETKIHDFKKSLQIVQEHQNNSVIKQREILNRVIYTSQQCIGFALDSIASNQAKKLNGDLFEHFINLVLHEIGIRCRSGIINVPVIIDGEKLFNMNYQHDLILDDGNGNNVQLIGSIKTTSKDRIDKIFIDKFMFHRLTGNTVPFIAIFLHDVQRKGQEPKYGISATFLPGHFKGYAIKLTPLDGVYYLDPRPNMITDDFLKQHIQTFDNLICTDIWNYV